MLEIKALTKLIAGEDCVDIETAENCKIYIDAIGGKCDVWAIAACERSCGECQPGEIQTFVID